MESNRENEIIGTFRLKDPSGKLERDNLMFPADKKTICEYEESCDGDCESEIEYERIEGDPEYVRIYCHKIKEKRKS